MVDDVGRAIAVEGEGRVADAECDIAAPEDRAVVEAPPVAWDHCVDVGMRQLV